MGDNKCREFFELQAANLQKVKLLQEVAERVEWEKQTASPHSPGVVDDAESLVRRILSPIHWDQEEGVLKPAAFDDVSNKGLSIDRLKHAVGGLDAILHAGRKLIAERPADRSPASFWGVAILLTSDVRALVYEGARSFGIYDTGLHDNPAHGDICQLVAGKFPGRSARHQLWSLAKKNLQSVSATDAG